MHLSIVIESMQYHETYVLFRTSDNFTQQFCFFPDSRLRTVKAAGSLAH